ncbi:MAG: portal protein [Candidatus Saccharimonadales bacterium]
MAVSKFYKIIKPQSDSINTIDNYDTSGSGGLYGNYTWFHRLVQGSAARMQQYREYDSMDLDVDVSRAIDLIAEEVLGNNSKDSDGPMLIKITSETEHSIPSSTVVTLKAALKTWCAVQNWDNRLFPIIRACLKYGDQFMLRPRKKSDKYIFVATKHVVGAVVPEEDVTNVLGWNIKTDFKRVGALASGSMAASINTGLSDSNAHNIETFDKTEVVRFTLNNDTTADAPFGESILRAIYRTFKQKELLEDSILIYRIQRAPERRVFYIDTGTMSSEKVGRHLEQVKNEFRQKMIPSMRGGDASIESTYNPQTMNQDFFFARRKDGTGSTVETLPSVQNLGSLEDLDYFYRKLWRGLKVPQSYMDSGSDGGGGFSDGKVGIALMHEIKFILYVERLQKQIETTLDTEFKRFLHDQNIKVDGTIFKVILPPPSNFAKSKQQAMDAELLNNYNSVIEDPSISRRYAQKRYLGWSEEEIVMNARMKLEELGINPDKATRADLMKVYSPDNAELGGFEGGMGGGSGGSLGMPLTSEVGNDEVDMEGDGMDDGSDIEDVDAEIVDDDEEI